MGFPLPKHNHFLDVPLRYHNINFTVGQCSFPGFIKNKLMPPTAYAILGMVHMMAYMRLPTMDEYETFLISTFSFLLIRCYSVLNMKMCIKWHANGFGFMHVEYF